MAVRGACHPEYNKSIGHCGPCVVLSKKRARQRRNEVCVFVLFLLGFFVVLLCFVHSVRVVYFCVACVRSSFTYFLATQTEPAEIRHLRKKQVLTMTTVDLTVNKNSW